MRTASLISAFVFLLSAFGTAVSSPTTFRVVEGNAFRFGTSSIIDGRADEIYECLVDNEGIQRLELCKEFFQADDGTLLRKSAHGRFEPSYKLQPATDEIWLIFFDGFVYGYEFFLEHKGTADTATPNSLNHWKTDALIKIREIELQKDHPYRQKQ